jgi:hypothetical protein
MLQTFYVCAIRELEQHFLRSRNFLVAVVVVVVVVAAAAIAPIANIIILIIVNIISDNTALFEAFPLLFCMF